MTQVWEPCMARPGGRKSLYKTVPGASLATARGRLFGPTPATAAEQLNPEEQLGDDAQDQKGGDGRAATEPGTEQVRGYGDGRIHDQPMRPGCHCGWFKMR